MSVTTTKNCFRVEDVSFKHARKQSEIYNEIEHEEIPEDEVKAPTSLTPEQVISFYKDKISKSKDSNEKRLYSQTITWIKDYFSVKKALVDLREKEISRTQEDMEVTDIPEE